MKKISLGKGGIPDLVLCVFFLGAIFAPHLPSAPRIVSTENRVMTQKPVPDFSSLEKLKNFPKEYEAYFNDNFGFRNFLVRSGARIKLLYLQISPAPGVLVGKKGWYYYNGDRVYDGSPISNYRGLGLYDERTLRGIRRKLEKQRIWLAARGIRYLIFLAPDKPTIYPEFMPDSIRVVSRRTRTDQLFDYLKKTDSRVRILDLRNELVRGKGLYPVYYKTDHHWNRFGGFIAAQSVVQELSHDYPELEPFSISNYEVTLQKQTSVTDLAEMMAMPRELDDDEVMFRLKPETLSDPSQYRRKSPKILIFHESFINCVLPFLQDHFADIQETRWDAFSVLDYGLIEHLKPDVVILELEESYQGALG